MKDRFKHRAVQDLAWVISSPPLISGQYNSVDWWDAEFFTNEYQACLPTLQELNHDPEPLVRHLSMLKSKRLGHYFEGLVNYWLMISPNFDLIISNLPIRAAGKTLGELDCIVFDKTSQQTVHLEVAVKFYLGYGDLNNKANWHGPELRDRLDIKFQHLCDHQTQLSHKHPSLIPHSIDTSACLVKGRLFYPPTLPPQTDFTTSSHLSGHWLTLPERHQHHQEDCWLELPKNNWLAPVEYSDLLELHALPEVLEKPACFALFKEGVEQARLFLLPEGFWQNI